MTTVPLSQVRQKRALEEALDQAVAAARSQKWKDVGASVAEERAEGVRQAIREGRFADVLRGAQHIAESIEAHRSKPGAWAAFAREVVRIVPVVSTRPIDATPAPAPVVSLPPPAPVAVVAPPEVPAPAEEPAPQAPPPVAVVALPPANSPEEEPKEEKPAPRAKRETLRGGGAEPLSAKEQRQLRVWVDQHGRATLERITGIQRHQVAGYLRGAPATPKTRAALLAAISKPPPAEARRTYGGAVPLPADLLSRLEEAAAARGVNQLAEAWGIEYRLVQSALEAKAIRPHNLDRLRELLSEPLPPPPPPGRMKLLFALARAATDSALVKSCLRLREAGLADGLADVARAELAAAMAAGSNDRARRCQLALGVLIHGEAGAEKRGVSVEEAPAEKPRRPGRPKKEAAPAPGLSYPELPQDLSGLKPEEIVLAESASPAPAPAPKEPSNPEPALKETAPNFKTEEIDLTGGALRQVARDVAREAMAAALEVVRERIRAVLDEEIESIRGEIGGGR
jgi:hypothetical protein